MKGYVQVLGGVSETWYLRLRSEEACLRLVLGCHSCLPRTTTGQCMKEANSRASLGQNVHLGKRETSGCAILLFQERLKIFACLFWVWGSVCSLCTCKARCLCLGLLHSVRASHIWASVQILGAHAAEAVRRRAGPKNTPQVQHLGTRVQDAGSSRRGPSAPSPISRFPARRETQLSKGKNKRARRPPAPHPAFKSGRGVSSNLSPPRPRTPPPPPLPKRATKGRARRVPPEGFHGGTQPQTGPPLGPPGDPREEGAADKDPSPGEGPAGAGPWKALEKRRGAHHGRGRAGPDPRRLRAAGAGRPGARAGGAHREGPRGATATPEGAPSAGAVRSAARTDHGRRGPSGLGVATGRTGVCGLHRLRGAGARLRGRRAGLYQARGTHRRRGVAAAKPLRRVGERGAYQERPRGGVAGLYQNRAGGASGDGEGVWGGEHGHW